MNKERPSRKLVAIMFTDIVGYTALVERNEAISMEILENYRNISRPIFKRYNGREIRTMGDGFFVEFASVVEAVECAISLQSAFEERNQKIPPEKTFYVRIGINAGDVIAQEGDIYGTAVNIAARIEPLAYPGGICLTEQVYDQIKGIVSLKIKSIGFHKLKNLKNHVELFCIDLPWLKMEDKAISSKKIEKKRRTLKILNFGLLLILFSAFLFFGIYFALKSFKKIEIEKKEKIESLWIDSIAILPFVNMTLNKENDLLCDGITEEIISSLSRIKGLKVCARTSVFFFKGKEIDIRTIGKKLKVNLVLEGSVRKAENQYKITAQLIEAKSGFHLWSDSYLLENIDPLFLQEKIALNVANKLKRNIGINKIKKSKYATENSTAYNLYLKGRAKWNKRTPEDLKQAIEFYKIAKEFDPEFALANLGIAECYVVMPSYGILSGEEAYKMAKKYALLALEKDSYLAEAYATLAIVYDLYEWDWEKATKNFEKAIYIKPSYATAHQWFSQHLRGLGKLDEALKHAKIALELDPLSSVIRETLADTYYDRREYDKAKEHYESILKIDKDFIGAHLSLSGIYLNIGKCKEAMEQVKLEKDFSKYWIDLKKIYEAWIYAHCGDKESAKKIAKEIELKIEKEKTNYYMFLSLIYCSLGEYNEALKFAEKAIKSRDVNFFFDIWEKDFDLIRLRKEYKELIIKYKLPENLSNFKASPQENEK